MPPAVTWCLTESVEEEVRREREEGERGGRERRERGEGKGEKVKEEERQEEGGDTSTVYAGFLVCPQCSQGTSICTR